MRLLLWGVSWEIDVDMNRTKQDFAIWFAKLIAYKVSQ